jgi:hypothetical protein
VVETDLEAVVCLVWKVVQEEQVPQESQQVVAQQVDQHLVVEVCPVWQWVVPQAQVCPVLCQEVPHPEVEVCPVWQWVAMWAQLVE